MERNLNMIYNNTYCKKSMHILFYVIFGFFILGRKKEVNFAHRSFNGKDGILKS